MFKVSVCLMYFLLGTLFQFSCAAPLAGDADLLEYASHSSQVESPTIHQTYDVERPILVDGSAPLGVEPSGAIDQVHSLQSRSNATSPPETNASPSDVTSSQNTTVVESSTPSAQNASTPVTNATSTTKPSTQGTVPTTARPPIADLLRNCTIGQDVLHVLFNRTTMEQGMFGVENSLGLVGDREDIISAVLERIGTNHSRGQVGACVDLYRLVPELLDTRPDYSSASLLSYQRPEHLGGVPSLPVQRPPNPNFNYGHGYTTYLNPLNIASRVPEYQPHSALRAGSLQDLLATLYSQIRYELDLLFEHGTPAYWFGRPAVTRRPSTG